MMIFMFVLDNRHSSVYGSDGAPFTGPTTATFTVAVATFTRWTTEQSSFVSKWCVSICRRLADTCRHVKTVPCRQPQHYRMFFLSVLELWAWWYMHFMYAYELLCIVRIVQLMLSCSRSVSCMHLFDCKFTWMQQFHKDLSFNVKSVKSSHFCLLFIYFC